MSFLSNLFGAEEIQAQSDALDAQRARMNIERAERMAREQDQAAADRWLEQTKANDVLSQNAGLGPDVAVAEDVQAGWDQGYEEGKQNVTDVVAAPFKLVGDAASSVLGGVFKGVPWWAWAALAVGVFLYFGGGTIARAFAIKKFAK